MDGLLPPEVLNFLSTYAHKNHLIRLGIIGDLSENLIYRKIASSNTSHLEAHAGFFRMLVKGIFDPYVL